MITRMTSDVNQLQNRVNLALRLLLRSPFVVFGAMVMAFTIDVPGATVFAVAIPVLLAVVFAIILVTIPMYRKVQNRLDGVTAATRENLTGVRVLRAFRKEQEEIAGFPAKPAAEPAPAPGRSDFQPAESGDLCDPEPGSGGPPAHWRAPE